MYGGGMDAGREGSHSGLVRLLVTLRVIPRRGREYKIYYVLHLFNKKS